MKLRLFFVFNYPQTVMRKGVATIALLGAASGCVASGCDGDETFDPSGGGAGSGALGGAPSDEARICDGSSSLRFAWQRLSPYAADFDGVQLELGLTLLLVDGHCEFTVWSVGEPWLESYGRATAWGPVRTGKLDPREAERLAEDFSWRQWSDHAGQYYGRDVLPQPELALLGPKGAIYCTACVNAPEPIGSIARDVFLIADWLQGLYALGRDLDGPVRLRVFQPSWEGEPAPFSAAWPLHVPPETLVLEGLDRSDLHGQAQIIASARETKALRMLRTELLGEPDALALRFATQVDGNTYDFVFRDVLPFEVDGFIPELDWRTWKAPGN